jgi:hypothetical protein
MSQIRGGGGGEGVGRHDSGGNGEEDDGEDGVCRWWRALAGTID